MALVAALVALLLPGCRRETPAPAKALVYEHPNYARLSPAELLIEGQRKGVMGRKQSLRDVRRVVETIAPLVAQSVEQEAIQADLQALAGGRPVAELREELRRWQEADLLLESGGDPEAVSAAGAVGVAQWLADTARRAGL
ncbi:MAG TPA: lytic transglycosylase domain-containing protein, partial [Armatimonadetes bacterium]|nr:lytic transglycosylase domain-containing protein [Armatimonadota bacterium]